MYGNKYTISDNGVVPCDDDDTSTRTTQDAQRQINAILASRTTTSSIKAFTNQAKRNYDEFFFFKMTYYTRPVPSSSAPLYAKNGNHYAFLYHRWNYATTNNTSTIIRPCTNKPRPAVNSKTVAHALTERPIKDEPSVTPTPETLCTIETYPSHPTNINNDAILNNTTI